MGVVKFLIVDSGARKESKSIDSYTGIDGQIISTNSSGVINANLLPAGGYDGTYVRVAGDTMTGNLNMGANDIVIGAGGKITITDDPVNDTDATNKKYVDNAVQGLKEKTQVRCATTANITLSGSQTVDGISVTDGDRVLVKNQTDATENGIYVVDTSGAWSRSDDADTWDELVQAYVFVEVGTVNADSGWKCTVDSGGTLGTDDVNWVQFSQAGTITGTNLGSGAEVYESKVGTQLRFRTISEPTSNLITITQNANDIVPDIDITELEQDLNLNDIASTGTAHQLSLANGGTGNDFVGASGTQFLWVSGGAIVESGYDENSFQGQDATLDALSNLDSTTGIMVQTNAGATTFAKRSIVSADGSVTITNPDGVSGNIDLSVSASAVDHGSLSGLGDDDHTQYVHISTARTVSAQHTYTGTPAFNPTSGAPFSTNSTTIVTNLNTDLLDGQHGTYYLDLSNATGTLPITHGGTGVTTFTDQKVIYFDQTAGQLTSASYDHDDVPLDTFKTIDLPSGSDIVASGKDNTLTFVNGDNISITNNAGSIQVGVVDGSGSGLDADTLDGHDSSYFATATDLSNHIGSGGTAHAEATESLAGFMSASDKEKLNDIDVRTSAIEALEDLSAGDAVHIVDSGGLKVRKASANSSDQYPADGFIKDNCSSGSTVQVYFVGINSNVTGLSIGADVYLSDTTAGGYTTTAPNGTGELVQRVGVALSANSFIWQRSEPIELA